MEKQDYPKLYRESDILSIDAKRKHFWIVRSEIAILLFIAGITSIAWDQVPNLRVAVEISSAILLVTAVFLSAILQMRKYDLVSFSGRAVGESIKTESWKFMMKTEPYNGAISDSVAEERFITRLGEILRRQPSICSELAPFLQDDKQITEFMRHIRGLTFQNRQTEYIKSRLEDQRLWYAEKAGWNKNQESKWFIITWMLQLAAIAFAIVVIGLGDYAINPVSILTTVGACVFSWTHARSYRELSQSYGLTAQELSLLESRARLISTEEELVEMVEDVERTISREHTVWLVRRV